MRRLTFITDLTWGESSGNVAMILSVRQGDNYLECKEGNREGYVTGYPDPTHQQKAKIRFRFRIPKPFSTRPPYLRNDVNEPAFNEPLDAFPDRLLSQCFGTERQHHFRVCDQGKQGVEKEDTWLLALQMCKQELERPDNVSLQIIIFKTLNRDGITFY